MAMHLASLLPSITEMERILLTDSNSLVPYPSESTLNLNFFDNVDPFSSSSSMICYLPQELQTAILNRLNDRDYCYCRLVCRRLHYASLVTLPERRAKYVLRNYGPFRAWIYLAAVAADIPALDWMNRHSIPMFTSHVMDFAARLGRVEILEWLNEKSQEDEEEEEEMDTSSSSSNGGRKVSLSCTEMAIEQATKNRWVNVILWLIEHRPTESEHSLAGDIAVRTGDLELVKLIHQHLPNAFSDRKSWEEEHRLCSHDSAATMGHLEVLKWLQVNRPDDGPCSHHAMDQASSQGFLHILQFLQDTTQGKIECTTQAMDCAALAGHLEVIKWLHENRKEGCTSVAMDSAAEIGRLDIVIWLHQNRQEGCTVAAIDLAATEGHLEVVKWLSENRKEGCTVEAILGAASNGHLAVLKYLHERTTERPARAITLAAEGNFPDVVRWLYENGYRAPGQNTGSPVFAAKNGDLKLLRWLLLQRKERCDFHLMDAAAEYGHIDIVKWLHLTRSEGCSTDAMDEAAGNNHLHIVKWLHMHRTEGCSTKAMDLAAERGHLEMLKWLEKNRSEGCTIDAIDSAAEAGHWKVILWLRQNRYTACSTPLARWYMANIDDLTFGLDEEED